jgi:predicted Zn-dependent peptidase
MKRDGLFNVHKARTPAGLRLRVVPMAGTGTVTLMILVGTGSRHETPDQSGISHFLEHLFFKGSRKRPTTRLISETIDSVGGEFNAFTSKEMTAFHAKAGAQHAPLLLDVIGDMLLHPLFSPKEIDRERGVITEEINMYEDMPLMTIGEEWETLLYGRHALGRQVIGTKEIVATLPRRAFLSYVGRQYSAANTVACLAGNIDPAYGTKLLTKALTSFPQAAPKRASAFKGTWGVQRVSVKEKKTDQAHVMIGGPGVSYTHADRPAVDVLCAILGGSMSSRMFLEVRERRGLAYSVRTFPEHFVDTGYVATQAGVPPRKFPEAVKVILRQYRKIRTQRVPAAELKKAKETLKGRLLLKLESSDAVAQFVGGQEVLTQRILTVDEVFQRLEAVTPDEVRRVAETALKPSRLRLNVIGEGRTPKELADLLRRYA